MKKKDMTQAHQANKAAAKERQESREVLKDGYVLYKDSPPGIGWVLEKTSNGHKKYFATPEQAKQMFFGFYKGFY